MNNEKEVFEEILKSTIISENNEKTIFKIIPELLAEKDFLQNNPWHIYDVWNHTKKVFQTAKISYSILKRLGYSEDVINEICFLIENHDKSIQIDSINQENLVTMKKLLYIQYCDSSGYNPEYIQRVHDRLDEICSKIKVYEKCNINKVNDIEK